MGSLRQRRRRANCDQCHGGGGPEATPCEVCGRTRHRRSDAGKPRRPPVARNERPQYTFTARGPSRLIIDFDPTAGRNNWRDLAWTMRNGRKRAPVTAFYALTQQQRKEHLAGSVTKDVSTAPDPPEAAVRDRAAFMAEEAQRRGWQINALTTDQETQLTVAYSDRVLAEPAVLALWSSVRAMELVLDEDAIREVARRGGQGTTLSTLRKTAQRSIARYRRITR